MEPLFFLKKEKVFILISTKFPLKKKKKKFLQGNFLVGSVGPLDKTSVIVSVCPLWSVKSTSQVTFNIFKVFLQPGFWGFFPLRWVIFRLIWDLLCFPSIALLRFTWRGFYLQRNCLRVTLISSCIFFIIIYSFFYLCHSALCSYKNRISKELWVIFTGYKIEVFLFLCLRSRAKTWINAVLTHIHQTVV